MSGVDQKTKRTGERALSREATSVASITHTDLPVRSTTCTASLLLCLIVLLLAHRPSSRCAVITMCCVPEALPTGAPLVIPECPGVHCAGEPLACSTPVPLSCPSPLPSSRVCLWLRARCCSCRCPLRRDASPRNAFPSGSPSTASQRESLTLIVLVVPDKEKSPTRPAGSPIPCDQRTPVCSRMSDLKPLCTLHGEIL